VAIVDPRAAKLVTGRHWIEDDGAARLEATEKGIVERRGVRNVEARKNPTNLQNQVFVGS